MSQNTKPSVEENEKLKELVNAVNGLNQASEEALKGGGTAIEDDKLEIAKRRVTSYQKYLAEKYGGEPESYNVNLDEKETVKVGESGPEKVNVESTKKPVADSPDVAKF